MAEIISLATMLTGVGGDVVIPYINKLLGPSADELGLVIGEHARIYRLKNAFRLFKRANEMTTEAGFEPKQVSMKSLLPLLEGASLEDDESLADKWAALLSNASDPASKTTMKPAYAEILRQLIPQEVQLLDKIFEQIHKLNPLVSGIDISSTSLSNDEYWRSLATSHVVHLGLFRHLYSPTLLARHEFNALADNLLRQRLIVAATNAGPERDVGAKSTMYRQTRTIGKPNMDKAYLSALGFDFMLACTPPQPAQ
jgi:hypothetical protein